MTAPRIATVAGVTPVVQLGIGDTRGAEPNAGRWDVSRWDAATGALWASSEPQWLDITCDVHGVDSRVGHGRTLDRWDVGTTSIDVSNESGWADPLGSVIDPALLVLRPGRQLRWGIRDDATNVTHWRFRGWLDRHAATYEGMRHETDSAVLECIDALGEVGRAALAQLAAAVGAGETATARVQRILDAIGWRSAWRNLDAVNVPLMATKLGAQAADLLSQVADSTGASVYGDYDGRLRLRHRDWQTWLPDVPPDAVIGNTLGAVCPTSIEVTAERAVTLTRAIVNYEGSTAAPVVRDDAAAQLLYGVETAPELTDLVTDDAIQLGQIADRLLAAQGASTQPRITGVVLDAARGPDHVAAMLAADPYLPTRWQVIIERNGRTIADRMMLVTTVEHSWDAHGWVARIGLDDALPWRAAGGRWDGAYWDAATWSPGVEAALLDLLHVLEGARA